MDDVEAFELSGYTELDRTYWNALTITVGELMEADMVTKAWFTSFDAYDDAQASRLWYKFVGRYQFREIGILPPKRWMLRVIAKLNEVMPKYKPLYQAIDNGITTMTGSDEWHKSRDVFSTFPQTALGGANEDYASSGTDKEYETVRDYGLLDVGERIGAYNDVDTMLLDDLDVLFMSVRTTSIPWM